MTDVSIWMPIVWADYDKDTSRLSLEQHGIYLMLIKEYWNNAGPLENDVFGIYRSLGALTEPEQKNVQFILQKYFKLKENLFNHSRIDEELKKAKENRKNQHNRTKAATAARRNKQRDVDVTNDVAFTPSPTPPPSPSSILPVIKEPPPTIIFGGVVLNVFEKEFAELKGKFPNLDLKQNLQEADKFFSDAKESGDSLRHLKKRLNGFLKGRSDVLPKTESQPEPVSQHAIEQEQAIAKLNETKGTLDSQIRLELIRLQGLAIYFCWIHPLKFIVQEKDKLLFISAPSGYIKNYIQNNYHDTIDKLAEKHGLMVDYFDEKRAA